MNTLIKILTAIALIAVTVAAVVHVITRLDDTDTNLGPSGKEKPTTEEVQRDDHEPKPEKPPVAAKPGETIRVRADDPLLPEYRPINSPEILQNMRKKGKTYCSAIVGRVSGRARKKDWGFAQGTAHFNYIYMMKTTGKILENDGVTIVEERSFDSVSQDCVVSDISVGVSLPENVSKFIDPFVRLKTAGLMSGKDVVKFVNSIRWKVSEEELRELGFDVKGKVKMFTEGKDGSILEGKKVRIVFKDGTGVPEVTPIDGCMLTEEEKNIIIRTNYAMDHYLMPDTKVAVGEKWKIKADVFSGLIDPRLEGKIEGEVTVERMTDFRTEERVNTRLRLVDGNISVVKPGKEGTVSGEITRVTGRASRPDGLDVVASAWLQGYVQYREVSPHHLLFNATMETEPRFEVKYECEVQDN